MLQWKKAIWRKTRKILLQRVGAEFYNGLQYQKLLNPASFLVLAFRFAWYKNPLSVPSFIFFHLVLWFSFGNLVFGMCIGCRCGYQRKSMMNQGHPLFTSSRPVIFLCLLCFSFLFLAPYGLWLRYGLSTLVVIVAYFCSPLTSIIVLKSAYRIYIYICIYCLSSLTVTLYHSHEIAQLPLLACLVFCPCSLVECGMLTKLCYFSCQSNYMAIFRCGSCDLPA